MDDDRKTRIVFSDQHVLVVDQPASDVARVLGEMQRGEGGPFRVFTAGGTDVFIVTADRIAYIKPQ